jgi:hypothetical protein
MNIAWLRDLTIVVWGILSIVVTATFGLIMVGIYRRMKIILGSAEVASANIAELSSMAREAAGPVMKITGVIQVIAKTLGVMRGFGKYRKEVDDG